MSWISSRLGCTGGAGAVLHQRGRQQYASPARWRGLPCTRIVLPKLTAGRGLAIPRPWHERLE